MRYVLAFVLLLGCPSAEPEPVEPPTPAPPTGERLFAEGCPIEGQSLARVIGVDQTLPGEAAVGTAGDFLLANERAAFVITDAVGQATYWYYGGALADAARVEGCATDDDRLDELGFVFAKPDLFNFEQSILRAFEATSVEVLNDGSDGGAAIVRARGHDSIHWLVEHTLIKEAASSGGRPYSAPYEATITVDYILPPDSATLQIDINVINSGDAFLAIADAALFQWGASLDTYAYSSGPVEVGGLNLDAGLPWLVATDGEVSYALGVDQANLATVTFSGVQVGVDLNSISDGFNLPAGQDKTLSRFFSVGETASDAVESLMGAVDAPLREEPATVGVIEGTVANADGNTVVRVDARGPEAGWGTLYRLPLTDSAYRAVVPVFDAAWEYRVRVEGAGRDASEPVPAAPGDTVDLDAQPLGTLSYLITNDGERGPGKLHLRRDDGATFLHWLAESGEIPVPPGEYAWTVTRGYEFNPARGTVTVGETGSIEADLTRAFSTDGWISVDTHVHSSDSPDSRVPPGDQLRKAAAHGLDIVVHTEHENIVDRSTVPADIGLGGWVNNVTGEEVTSVAVEHMTMFPAVPDGTPRGGPVHWYGENIAELFANMRERSNDGVNLINHPGWLDHIGWDRVLGGPTLDNPTLLGFEADDPLWDWNLDGVEVMNGHGNPFIDGRRRFDNWISMVNAGHQVIAVGCSDDHGGLGVGFPRTYVTAPSDLPSELDDDALVDSFRGGHAMASAGGFARVDVDGSGPGELVADTDGSVDLNVSLWAMPELDVTHFVVFANCDMVASVLVDDPAAALKHSGSVPVDIDGDTHLVVAAFGTNNLPDGLPGYNATRTPRVLTNPIYIDADGDGAFAAPGGRECDYDLDVSAAE